jgi:SAM-dependent methyltransferase
MEDVFDINRRNWEDRVAIHLRDTTGFYNIKGFLAGEDTLTPIEAAEIGDIRGKRLLHLQCHFGLDTLSLARRGADVTGLDISPSAIAAARDLAQRAGLQARFVEGNVYDAPALVPGPFDIVFTTWGTINWLPDIRRWAQTIAAVLAPGGFFYFADGHPNTLLLDQAEGRLFAIHRRHSAPDAPAEDGGDDDLTTYTGDPTPLVNTASRTWTHSLSGILTVLLDAGLTIEMVHEHDAVPWEFFPMTIKGPDRLYRLPEDGPGVPLGLSLKARKTHSFGRNSSK